MPMPAPITSAPRVGFLGVGWIGQHRLRAVAEDREVEIAAIADPLLTAEQARALAPEARLLKSMEELWTLGLDGLVIATPSALHAEQSLAALEQGLAVFCQKPLGRTSEETRRVTQAARRSDRLLGVDFSYRFVHGATLIRDLIRSGSLGDVYCAELVFHNAYGPDKAWFYDARLSGGGCMMDLGIHLIDLALWALGSPTVLGIVSRLFRGGRPLARGEREVEDHAVAQLDLEGGATVRIACSWRLHAGCDAVIEASFFGTRGGARLRNVGGSFYDFTAERFDGTRAEVLAEPPDAWGGRAVADWARRLAAGERYDEHVESVVEVARVLDRIYGR